MQNPILTDPSPTNPSSWCHLCDSLHDRVRFRKVSLSTTLFAREGTSLLSERIPVQY